MAFDLSIIPSLIGLGAKTAGAIPGLRKPKRTDAGSRAAAKASSQIASAAVGGAQAGGGATRGLALREGIRGAAGLAASASGEVAQAARQDEADFQGLVRERNARINQFASGAAEGLAGATQAILQPQVPGVGSTGAPLLQRGGDQGAGQAAATLPGAEQPEQGSILDPEVQALQGEVGAVQQAEQTAEDVTGGPTAQFGTTNALEELAAAAPTVAAPQIEKDLENRLQAKKLMLQDAERFGLDLNSVWASVNRRLGLRPGQSTENPFGVQLDLNQGEQ